MNDKLNQTSDSQIEQLFVGKSPEVRAIYKSLIGQISDLDYQIEVKKTGLHLTQGAAFLGVNPKKNWLDITLVNQGPIEHAQLKKAEQLSKNRWHNDLRLFEHNQIDEQLVLLIKQAYELRKK